MSQVCNCDTGLHNLHSADCVINPGIARKFIFVNARKSDGTPNGIDLSQPFGETEIDALINESDNVLRWHITDKFKNFTTDRADPVTEDVDGESLFVSQGTRSMSVNYYGSSSALAKKLDGNRCVDLAFFIVDGNNGLTGVVERDLWLDPIELNKESFFSKVIFPTEANVFNVQSSFQWDKLVCDGNMRTLGFDEHATNLLKKVGLTDVFARFGTANLTTEIQVEFYDVDGSAKAHAFTGLTLPDFSVFNSETGSPVAVVPSGVVEGPDGTYVLTIPAQGTGDPLTVTATKTGFDFTATLNEVITAL